MAQVCFLFWRHVVPGRAYTAPLTLFKTFIPYNLRQQEISIFSKRTMYHAFVSIRHVHGFR